jgi:hypothetical protein
MLLKESQMIYFIYWELVENKRLYTNDGILNIDNNPVENSIRRVALGYVKLCISWAERITCLQAAMKPPAEVACCIVYSAISCLLRRLHLDLITSCSMNAKLS